MIDDVILQPFLNAEFARCKTLEELNSKRKEKSKGLGAHNGELMAAYTLHFQRISKEMKQKKND